MGFLSRRRVVSLTHQAHYLEIARAELAAATKVEFPVFETLKLIWLHGSAPARGKKGRIFIRPFSEEENTGAFQAPGGGFNSPKGHHKKGEKYVSKIN